MRSIVIAPVRRSDPIRIQAVKRRNSSFNLEFMNECHAGMLLPCATRTLHQGHNYKYTTSIRMRIALFEEEGKMRRSEIKRQKPERSKEVESHSRFETGWGEG